MTSKRHFSFTGSPRFCLARGSCSFQNPISAGGSRLCYLDSPAFSSTSAMPTETARLPAFTFSMRVIAGAIFILFCYYAAGVVITLLLSILIAYFLDPAVELLERARLPRIVGALVMVLVLIA